jgi:hypothetical protein
VIASARHPAPARRAHNTPEGQQICGAEEWIEHSSTASRWRPTCSCDAGEPVPSDEAIPVRGVNLGHAGSRAEWVESARKVEALGYQWSARSNGARKNKQNHGFSDPKHGKAPSNAA